MEYKQARMREVPNEDLVARHQREIAPLLKKRWAFAESGNFVLYDFWNEHGAVDENVFAYSNVSGGERSLVLYNNVYGSTKGTVHVSAASMDKGSGTLRQRALVDAMQLPGDPAAIVAYKDTTSGLEYLRRAGELIDNGFSVELRGYQYVVLQEWREMRSTAEQPWDRLCDALHGAGVYNLGEALSKLRLRPVHDALREMLNPEVIGELMAAAATAPGNPKAETAGLENGAGTKSTKKRAKAEGDDPRLAKVVSRVETFFARAAEVRSKPLGGLAEDAAEAHRGERLQSGLKSMLRLPGLQSSSPVWPEAATSILPGKAEGELGLATWATLLTWAVLREMDGNGGRSAEGGTQTFDDLQLRSALSEIFSGLGVVGNDAWRAAARVRVLLGYGTAEVPGGTEAFWKDGDVRWLASVNDSGGKTYLNKEAFDELLWWLEIPALLAVAEKDGGSAEAGAAEVKRRFAAASAAAAKAGYEVEQYLAEVVASGAKKTVPEEVVVGTVPKASTETAAGAAEAPKSKTARKATGPKKGGK